MKHNVKTHLFAFVILAAFIVPAIVSAVNANDYNLLSPLPYVTREGTASTTSPGEYIKGIIKLAIGIAGVLAVLKIVIAGFQYITTENFSGKSNAKESIRNALVGLFLAISAYTILATINPALVNFTLTVDEVGTRTGLSDSGVCSVNEKGECVSPTSSTTPPTISCGGCVPMPDQSVIPHKEPMPAGAGCAAPGPCTLHSQLVDKLKLVASDLQKDKVSWQVSEMYPPTVYHKDPCHSNGICADITVSNPSITNLVKLFTALDKQFTSYEWEVCNDARRKALINDFNLYKWKSKIKCESTTTGESGHVEL